MSIERPKRGWSPIPDRPDDKAWYRQVWPWVLIGLPLASVIASFTTLFIAMEDPDGLVKDDYYRAGVAIQEVVERSRRAERMGLAGRLTLVPAGGELAFDFAGTVPPDAPALDLALRHATRAQHDAVLRLEAAGEGRYRAVLEEPLAPGNWNIQIDPPDDAWRIRGRGFVGQDATGPVTVEMVP